MLPSIGLCSDTISRCGVFCALLNCIECCKTESIVDVFQVVKALRIQKPGMIQSVASLTFCGGERAESSFCPLVQRLAYLTTEIAYNYINNI